MFILGALRFGGRRNFGSRCFGSGDLNQSLRDKKVKLQTRFSTKVSLMIPFANMTQEKNPTCPFRPPAPSPEEIWSSQTQA